MDARVPAHLTGRRADARSSALSVVDLATLFVVIAAIAALYAGVAARLWRDWLTDDNYAHGVLVLPVIAWLIWRQRTSVAAMTREPSWLGAGLVAASLALFLLGQATFEFFITRVSLLGVVAGVVVQLFGWRQAYALRFPLLLLAMAIPLPALVFNEIAFPLQLLASRFGVLLLKLLHVPAWRDGNIIRLSHVTLEVAEACSGVRSLISVLTLAVAYGALVRLRPSVHLLLALAAVPVVLLTNGLRVAGAGFMAHAWGASAATGFLHGFSGGLFFAGAVVLLFLVERAIAFGVHRWDRRQEAR